MRRFEYGCETWPFECLRLLYHSAITSPEDKKWVDSISHKSILKLSEVERIEMLYKQIFGENRNPAKEFD